MTKLNATTFNKHEVDPAELTKHLVAAIEARGASIVAEIYSNATEPVSPEADAERANKRNEAARAAVTAAVKATFIPMPETVIDCLHVALLVAELARKQLRLERRRQMRPEERAALHESLRALEEAAMLQPIDPVARARLTRSVAVWQVLLAGGNSERAAQRSRGLN